MVCLVHGLGEHIGRYVDTARVLTEAGYVLSGFDMRGHGKSEGKRGHTPSYDALMGDISLLIGESSRRFPNKQIFLFGHSLGGNLVLNYALRRGDHLQGVIATSPDLRLAFKPPVWKLFLANLMNHIWPSMHQSTGLDTDALSRIPEVVDAYKNDPLVHNFITPRMFVRMTEAGDRALKNAARFPCALLLMHGSGDRITSPEASREFAEKAGRRCSFKLWEGLFHEIHNEPEKKMVLEYMKNWLNSLTKEE